MVATSRGHRELAIVQVQRPVGIVDTLESITDALENVLSRAWPTLARLGEIDQMNYELRNCKPCPAEKPLIVTNIWSFACAGSSAVLMKPV